MDKQYRKELAQLKALRQEALFYDYLGNEFDLMVFAGGVFIVASAFVTVSTFALIGSTLFVAFGSILSQKCLNEIIRIEYEVKILLATSESNIKWK